MGEGNFRPPQSPYPPKNVLLVIRPTSATPTAVPYLVQIRPRGLLGKWVKYNDLKKNYLYFFFMNSPTGQTRRRIFTLGGSNDADSRKDVPFGGFVDIAPHFCILCNLQAKIMLQVLSTCLELGSPVVATDSWSE